MVDDKPEQHEEINLSPEEEEDLEAAWAKLDKENQSDQTQQPSDTPKT